VPSARDSRVKAGAVELSLQCHAFSRAIASAGDNSDAALLRQAHDRGQRDEAKASRRLAASATSGARVRNLLYAFANAGSGPALEIA
jgi:hypothetical protein